MTSPNAATAQPKSVFDLALETKYHLDDASIKELAYLYMTTEKVSGRAGEIYLRTLINRTKDLASTLGGTHPECNLSALDQAEAPMYEQVKRGTLTMDIQYNPLVDNAETRSTKAKEHNRRCNWARSIKSELKSMLKAGVSLDDVDVNTITKSDLKVHRKVKIEEAVTKGEITRPTTMAMARAMILKLEGLLIQAKAEGEDMTDVCKELGTLIVTCA